MNITILLRIKSCNEALITIVEKMLILQILITVMAVTKSDYDNDGDDYIDKTANDIVSRLIINMVMTIMIMKIMEIMTKIRENQ